MQKLIRRPSQKPFVEETSSATSNSGSTSRAASETESTSARQSQSFVPRITFKMHPAVSRLSTDRQARETLREILQVIERYMLPGNQYRGDISSNQYVWLWAAWGINGVASISSVVAKYCAGRLPGVLMGGSKTVKFLGMSFTKRQWCALVIILQAIALCKDRLVLYARGDIQSTISRQDVNNLLQAYHEVAGDESAKKAQEALENYLYTIRGAYNSIIDFTFRNIQGNLIIPVYNLLFSGWNFGIPGVIYSSVSIALSVAFNYDRGTKDKKSLEELREKSNEERRRLREILQKSEMIADLGRANVEDGLLVNFQEELEGMRTDRSVQMRPLLPSFVQRFIQVALISLSDLADQMDRTAAANFLRFFDSFLDNNRALDSAFGSFTYVEDAVSEVQKARALVSELSRADSSYADIKLASSDFENETIIQVENLSFAYGAKKVLDRASFAIQTNEVLMITGESGVGKTTLLKILHNKLQPQEGNVVIGDVLLDQTTRKYVANNMTRVSDESMLFLDRSVVYNLLYYFAHQTKIDKHLFAKDQKYHIFLILLCNNLITHCPCPIAL